jgi:hypothetical protein
MRKILLGAAALALAALVLPSSANAYYFYGPRVFVGVPFFAAPVYVPPPVYYAPPPVYAPAPVYSGRGCYAGPYVCPLDRPTPVGAGCSCPTNNGRAYGDAR